MPTVLIGSEPIRHQPGAFRTLLERSGFTVLDPPVEGKLTPDMLLEWLPGCDAVIAGGEPYSSHLIQVSPKLRAIARTGVGYDDVDVSAATSRGIPVTITPGANHEGVAEHTFALLLALAKNLLIHDLEIRRGQWNRTRLPSPIRGRTIGIVGLGRIGRDVAAKAMAFGMRVVAFDPFDAIENDPKIERMTFDQLLVESDVVSLHAPLVESTRGLFDAKVFARMRPGAWLINTARGGLIVEPDLAEALRTGHLDGAGLDVFVAEPPGSDNPLWALPNVVLSPHLAGVDTLSMSDMAQMAAQCLVNLHQGRWPEGCVINPEVAPNWHW